MNDGSPQRTFVSEVPFKQTKTFRRWNPPGVRLHVNNISAILIHEGAVQPEGMLLTPLPNESVLMFPLNNAATSTILSLYGLRYDAYR